MSMRSPALATFHPTLARWFEQTFGEPTAVQIEAWASILTNEHTLIAAPTGSGKTLAAFLPCLNKLARDKNATSGDWPPGVRVLYISPLKALNNDIQHHLTGFMEAIERYQTTNIMKASGDIAAPIWPCIRTAVRTGDTPSHERAKMVRRPPDVLITTPESLYLLLTSEKGRSMLQWVHSIIIDEIHNLASDKRGAHLSLTLERLSALSIVPVQRIGVSATQKPLERVARFLGGWETPGGTDRYAATTGHNEVTQRDRQHTLDAAISSAEVHPLGYSPRPVAIIESAMAKTMQVRVTMPDLSQLAKTRDAVWQPIVERLLQLMDGCRSVLLFVNSRRLCERLVLRLNDHAGHEMARAHHGSLSREHRLEVERMLKASELRCLVATSSLELGIDIGHIELVIQVDSPKEAASGIQRIGRAGHAVGDVSHGFILARNRSELPEAAVLCRSIIQREIEEIILPQESIDVLSQQVTAIVASEDISILQLHALITRSECYRFFPCDRLEAMLKVLAGFYPFARPLIDWDRNSDLLHKRANTAMAAITGAGTIPQSSAYPIHHVDSRIHLGELDEEYIQESRIGDVFQLGTSSWMISRIDNDRVYVKEAPNRFSEIPFWRNEPGGRGYELGIQLGQFISQLETRLQLAQPAADITSSKSQPSIDEREESTITWLDTEYGLDRLAASELIHLIQAQHRELELPTDKRIVIEYYRDLMNQMRVIIHNPFGRRINRTWLLAIERQFERVLPYKMYGNAKDNGIEMVLPEWDTSWLQTLWHITPDNLEPLLSEAIGGSPLLAISFRRIAETSLLLSRSFTRTPMWQKRLRSEELLKQSLPYAEHFPYLQEAMRECLHIYLDTSGLKKLLNTITAGQVDIVVKETKAPSPFAIQFLADYANAQMYEGDGLTETTQLQLMGVSKKLAGELFGKEAIRLAVDPAVAAVEARRLGVGDLIPSTVNELYTLLKQRGDLSTEEVTAISGADAVNWLDALQQAERIVLQPFGPTNRWICGDEREMYDAFPVTESAVAFVASRFAEHRLSFTEAELRERYPALSPAEAEHVVQVLLAHDKIEHSPFAADEGERIWTSRNVAKRLIRLTIEMARKQAEPIDPIRWCMHMSMLQHALNGTQLSGIDGLREVIAKLQGFYLPASHWESIVFPVRLTSYRKEDLDLLCATGEVIWLGRKDDSEKDGKIAFFLADSKPLYVPIVKQQHAVPASVEGSKHPELLALLQESGASFLTRLSRDTGKVPSELLADLIDLVWEGRVSNDQFAPLRLQLLTKGRQLAKTGSGLGRWYWTGSLTDSNDFNSADGSAESQSLHTPSHQPIRISAASSAELEGNGQQPLNRGQKDCSTVTNEWSESALHWTQHLLDSCGVVSKELVTKTSPYSWDELLPVLKQLEHWGVVTRGLLIRGVPTLQFAKRELIAEVRQPFPGQDTDAVTILSAVDPVNPFGLSADWPSEKSTSFSRKSGNYLVLHQGRWCYWLENNGRRVVEIGSSTSTDSSQSVARQANASQQNANGNNHDPHRRGSEVDTAKLLKQVFRTILRQHGLSKIKIERWNGEDIANSEGAIHIRALGAELDNRSFVLWPSQLQ
jgi:ATP-dependent Lhr-like helicase